MNTIFYFIIYNAKSSQGLGETQVQIVKSALHLLGLAHPWCTMSTRHLPYYSVLVVRELPQDFPPPAPWGRSLNESQIHVAIASLNSPHLGSGRAQAEVEKTSRSGLGLPTRLAAVAAATATQPVAYICVLTREIIFYFDHTQRIEKCPLISLGLCEGFVATLCVRACVCVSGLCKQHQRQ